MKTACQWAKHSKEQTTMIGLTILWSKKLQAGTTIAELLSTFS